jgi:hypothetical protein
MFLFAFTPGIFSLSHLRIVIFFSLALQPPWALVSAFQFHDHFTDGRLHGRVISSSQWIFPESNSYFSLNPTSSCVHNHHDNRIMENGIYSIQKYDYPILWHTSNGRCFIFGWSVWSGWARCPVPRGNYCSRLYTPEMMIYLHPNIAIVPVSLVKAKVMFFLCLIKHCDIKT